MKYENMINWRLQEWRVCVCLVEQVHSVSARRRCTVRRRSEWLRRA